MSGLGMRAHQSEAMQAIQLSREVGHKRGLLIIPPGGGKTFIGFEDALSVIQNYWEEGQNAQIIILVPTKHIRSQKVSGLKDFYPQEVLEKIKKLNDLHKELNIFITAVNKYDQKKIKEAQVIVTTYQFFNRHEKKLIDSNLPVKYVLVDEAGSSASPSYQKVIEAYQPDYILGLYIDDLTFEGQRALELLEVNRNKLPENRIKEIEKYKKIKLSDLYEGNILVDYSSESHIKDFIEKKYLSDIYVKTIDYKVHELKNIKNYIKNDENEIRDFDTPKMYKDLNQEKLNEDILNDYINLVPEDKKNEPTICTSLSTQHSDDLAVKFKNAGFKTERLHSKLTKKEQDKILEKFESGEIKILIVVDMLLRGYDFPQVGTILHNRPRYSRHSYLNDVGRIWRFHPDKKYSLIIDRTWNFERYASHNMHTVFNRRYQSIKTEEKGEPFFREGDLVNKDKKLVNYHFGNFLPFVDKEQEYALTANTLREWGMTGAHQFIKNIYHQLNQLSGEELEVYYLGVQFKKKDLNGIIVWTFDKSEKQLFVKAFQLLIDSFLLDSNHDLSLSHANQELFDRHEGLHNPLRQLNKELLNFYEENKTRVIKLTRNDVALEFILKKNHAVQTWTISKEKESDLIKFLGLRALSSYDELKDMSLTGRNPEIRQVASLQENIRKTLVSLIQEGHQTGQTMIIKNQNGIEMTFNLKYNNGKPIWVIDRNQFSNLIKFYGIEIFPAYDVNNDITISTQNKLLKKRNGMLGALKNILAELSEKYDQNPSQTISLTKNDITIFFKKKWRNNGPVWTVSIDDEKGLPVFFGLPSVPNYESNQDIRLTYTNEILFKYPGLPEKVVGLIRVLNEEAEKLNNDEIVLKRNQVELVFKRKWNMNKTVWTLPKTDENKLVKYFGLENVEYFDEKSDLAIINHNKVLLKKYPKINNSVMSLLKELKHVQQDAKNVELIRNNVKLQFTRKWKKTMLVWTIPLADEKSLIRFFER